MIIGYDRPKLTYTLTYASFSTDSSRLTNGRPASRTRLQITPDASNICVIEAVFDAPNISHGIAGFVGTDIPVGASVTCDFKRTGDASYGYMSQTGTVVQRRDGVRCLWIALTPGTSTSVIGVRFQIDVSSVPLVDGTGYIEIGELWSSPAIRHYAQNDYKRAVIENGSYANSISGQPFSTNRQQSHSHSFSLIPEEWAVSFGDQSKDLAYVRQAVSQHRPAVITPYVAAPYGGSIADNADVIAQNTAFGYFDNVGTEEYDKGCVVQFSGLKFIEPSA